MQPVIYADFRCLQDPNFQGRGIGYNTSALLRARRESALASSKLIGLTDPNMSPLPMQFRPLADQVLSSTNITLGSEPCIFMDGSPMTHDTRFSLRFQNHPSTMSVAVLHDYIPFDWPGYLPKPANRITYFANLARLKKFDLFLPVSRYTANRTMELLGVSSGQIRVTGACVRRALYELSAALDQRKSPYLYPEPYFVMLGGDDLRKNTVLAVRAVRLLNLIHGRRILLKVLGFYNRGHKEFLLEAAGHEYGKGFLEFYPDTFEEQIYTKAGHWHRPSITDEELVALHAGAIAAIAPSKIEGFSLPIVEAIVCGCPVIAGASAAQTELIQEPEAICSLDDPQELCSKLEALLHSPDLRESLLARQAYLAPKYHEREVGARFWNAVVETFDRWPKRVLSRNNQKFRIALLSGFAYDSEAALYTKHILAAANHALDVALFTEEETPLDMESNQVFEAKVSPAPLVDASTDSIVSVLDGPRSQPRIYRFFKSFGGPCILYDFRIARILFEDMGSGAFLDLVQRKLGRGVGIEEVYVWFEEQEREPLLLDCIVDRARPLIVNSRVQQRILAEQYGVNAHLTTCCPTLGFREEELSSATKESIRAKYGISRDAFVIATFGKVRRANGRDAAIIALDLLRSWNIPAELYFVGNAVESESELARVAELFGVSDHTHFGEVFESEETARDLMLAADAGLQLRAYAYGRVSVPVANCISAGLPCVTTVDTAKACDAPACLVRTVPDNFSPLHIAEEIASLAENGWDGDELLAARRAYLEEHNFGVYTRRLLEILKSA